MSAATLNPQTALLLDRGNTSAARNTSSTPMSFLLMVVGGETKDPILLELYLNRLLRKIFYNCRREGTLESH